MSRTSRARARLLGRSALLLCLTTPAVAQGPISAPEVRIGTSESDPRDQFAVIGDAVTLADGRIAVLDLGARIVRLYGRDGQWQRDLGRAGDGPGEYREPVALSVAGNTVIVLDNTGRLLLHPADGRDARTTAVRPPSPDDARFRLLVDRPISATQVLLRANERTFGRVRGDYRATTGLFAPALGVLASASASHIAVLVPETGQVTVFDVAGRRRAAWTTGWEPVAPSADDLARLGDDRLRGLGGNDARVVGEWLEGQRRFETTLPAGFELLEVRGDQLLGIRRNEDDVDILERRRLGATSSGTAQLRPYFPGKFTTVNGLAFEPDGRTLYVSRRVGEQDARGRPRVRLFRYTRDGDDWSAPTADTLDAATAAALDTANAAFSAAYLRGDVDALVGAYVPDVILHPPAGGVRLGTAAARGIWSGGADGRLGHRLEPLLRRRLSDVMVLEMGRWHSRHATAEDPNPAWFWGCYTVVWRKDDGASWRMYYDAWSAPHEEDWACRPRP